MKFSIKIKDEIKDLKELENIQPKVKQVRLVEELGKQGYQYDIKELFEPTTNTFKDVSEDVTRTMVEPSNEKFKTLTTVSNKLLEIMNDRGIITSYLMKPLSKITNPENTSQFILVKDSS